MSITVRNTRPADFAGIAALSRAVYPQSPPWSEAQLASHLRVFPEGQWVVVDGDEIVGMAASLIVLWDDYDMATSWRDFTAQGTFSNHDPANGRTLYGAEIMVHPTRQGQGIGSRIYAARRELVERLRLLRIRAGARLRGYGRHADRMTAEQYAIEVAHGRLYDPTVSFQIRRGFRILGLIPGYLRHDPESLGWAVCIEWLNRQVARPEDEQVGDARFRVSGEPQAGCVTG